jgi:hypothetical protein
MSLSPEIKTKLMLFVHRAIKPGECLLLARLLADRIPVVGVECEKPWEQTLQYRTSVDAVLFTLNEYIHISECNRELIYTQIGRLWVWRQSVASGQSCLVFSGSPDNVVDDLSGLMRSVNTDDLCPLADIAGDANYIYDLFKQVVCTTWN